MEFLLDVGSFLIICMYVHFCLFACESKQIVRSVTTVDTPNIMAYYGAITLAVVGHGVHRFSVDVLKKQHFNLQNTLQRTFNAMKKHTLQNN